MKAGFKRLTLIAMIVLYVVAGINHFWHPTFYIALIPPYLPNRSFINIASGLCEIVLGIMLVFKKTRKVACLGIIAMLIAFIPAHIYSIQLATLTLAKPLIFFIVWLRLFIIHPFLIAWPYNILRTEMKGNIVNKT